MHPPELQTSATARESESDSGVDVECALVLTLAEKLRATTTALLIVGEFRLADRSGRISEEHDLLARPFDTVAQRVAWLQSNPPHFAALYGDLPHYDAAYVRAVFEPVRALAGPAGRINAEHRSRWVNVVGGYRHTIDQPDYYERVIHVVGNSGVYGYGCEDRHTLPSQLQRIVNRRASDFGGPIAVFNRGARGTAHHAAIDTAMALRGRPGDAVVLQGVQAATIDRLRTLGVDDRHLLRPDFGPSAETGPMFIDSGHVNHRGQRRIAQQVASALLRLRGARRPLPAVDPAQRTLAESALAMARQRCRSLPDVLASDDALPRWIEGLRPLRREGSNGAVVLTANPFTRGHLHLVEYAARRVDRLYVFVVEEDRFQFDFPSREKMVRDGTRHLDNVCVLPSGRFVMSALSCPAYFDKESQPDAPVDACAELTLFACHVAPALGILRRFVGAEPLCAVTRAHNTQMRAILPLHGIRVDQIERLTIDGRPVSASAVRRDLRRRDFSAIAALLPPTTLDVVAGQRAAA